MALDPIVSLSVALAEAPGTCAFFLGSGVSRDAGVPTGAEVRRQGLHRLRQVELGTSDQVSDDELAEWLEESDHGDLSYSELLQLIAPDAAVRREYLAKYFEGVEPAQTHEALADLAVRGVVSVFVTTNFDRLLEHALLARGIEPVVVSSDAELAAAVPREHASCVVIKPHGDYLQQTIRNTSAELAELEPRMTQELAEVFERYGLVVLGYSGSDEGINEVLKQRRSRYGLWWVARSAPNDALGAMIGGLGGRVVRRESAADFLTDLDGRLAVFEQHPSGQTPEVVHDQTLSLLRSGDEIGLCELLRRERHHWNREVDSLAASARQQYPDAEAIRAVWDKLEPIVARRLAGMLPLVLYSPTQFATEFHALAGDLAGHGRRDGYELWGDLPQLAAAWVGYACGSVAVEVGHPAVLSTLVGQMWTDRDGFSDHLVDIAGDAANAVGQALAPNGTKWVAPFWEYLTRSTAPMPWVFDRYPEFSGEGKWRELMAQFDLVACLRKGFDGVTGRAFFALSREEAARFARQIHRDPELRARVASALGVEIERFEAEAPEIVRNAYTFNQGSIATHRVADALAGGR